MNPSSRSVTARAVLAAALLAALLAGSASSQVIVNGDMDGTAAFVSFNGVVPGGWAATPPYTPDLWNETSDFGGMIWEPSAGGGPFVHCAGWITNELVFQTVTGLTIGTSYDIEFEQAATKFSAYEDVAGFWQVTFGASTLDSDPMPIPPTLTPVVWEDQALTFTATATSQVLAFEAMAVTAGERVDLGLDSVEIFEVCDDALPGVEFVRLGTPPNPAALLPSSTGPPVIGMVWDPTVDHTTFVPDAVLDVYFFYLFADNIPFPPIGTILCDGAVFNQLRTPPDSLALPLPYDCTLSNVRLCVQAFSVEPSGNIFATNALDIGIGTF